MGDSNSKKVQPDADRSTNSVQHDIPGTVLQQDDLEQHKTRESPACQTDSQENKTQSIAIGDSKQNGTHNADVQSGYSKENGTHGTDVQSGYSKQNGTHSTPFQFGNSKQNGTNGTTAQQAYDQSQLSIKRYSLSQEQFDNGNSTVQSRRCSDFQQQVYSNGSGLTSVPPEESSDGKYSSNDIVMIVKMGKNIERILKEGFHANGENLGLYNKA